MSTAPLSPFHENASFCFQCSKCSAGCPVVEEMDLLPHQIMHSVALGEEEAALDSLSIWICAGCYTCAVRCPNDINVTAVLDELRKKAVESNRRCPKPETLKFHQTFLNDMNRRGRVHELRFMGEYNMKIGKPFNNAEMAPKMFLKGRLKVLPPKKIKGFPSWSRKIWNRKK